MEESLHRFRQQSSLFSLSLFFASHLDLNLSFLSFLSFSPLLEQYAGEADLPLAMSLVDAELSEPYSIFTYRYFLRNWPHLCFLAFDRNTTKRKKSEEEEEESEKEKQRRRQQPPPLPPPPPPGSRGGGCHHCVPTEEGE